MKASIVALYDICKLERVVILYKDILLIIGEDVIVVYMRSL